MFPSTPYRLALIKHTAAVGVDRFASGIEPDFAWEECFLSVGCSFPLREPGRWEGQNGQQQAQ
jgi:hypothetical protein